VTDTTSNIVDLQAYRDEKARAQAGLARRHRSTTRMLIDDAKAESRTNPNIEREE
jgi:hypothetical protein